MSPKTKTTKRKSHKELLNELELSIVQFVLARPALEHEIIHNYLTRNGYAIVEEGTSDRQLRRFGIPMPNKKELAWRAMRKAEALKFYDGIKKVTYIK